MGSLSKDSVREAIAAQQPQQEPSFAAAIKADFRKLLDAADFSKPKTNITASTSCDQIMDGTNTSMTTCTMKPSNRHAGR